MLTRADLSPAELRSLKLLPRDEQDDFLSFGKRARDELTADDEFERIMDAWTRRILRNPLSPRLDHRAFEGEP